MRPIVFDAAGTLVELAHPVGATYARFAAEAGGEVDPGAIERGFHAAMAEAPPLAFGDVDEAVREVRERAWWRAVALEALDRAGPPGDGFDPDRFFDRAWAWFATAEAWRVPDDVRPVLRALRRAGHPLAVLSNWDSRLNGLLDRLGIGGFFARVVVSSRLPAAKPAPAAFASATRILTGLGEGPPILVGDRVDHDVEPALAAGWGAILIDRSGDAPAVPEGAARIDDLARVPEALRDVAGARA